MDTNYRGVRDVGLQKRAPVGAEKKYSSTGRAAGTQPFTLAIMVQGGTTSVDKCIGEVSSIKSENEAMKSKQWYSKSSRFSLLFLPKGFLMLPTIPGPLHLTKIKYTSLLLELDLAFISDPKLGLF